MHVAPYQSLHGYSANADTLPGEVVPGRVPGQRAGDPSAGASGYHRPMSRQTTADRHVSLLRGINVGGHNLIPMTRLRGIYEALGSQDVETYLQSGNVVVRSDETPEALAGNVERAIARELGLDIKVLARTHAELQAIVSADPFPDTDPSRRLVMFLSDAPAADKAAEFARVTSGPDEAILLGREMHLHCPNGIGRTKLIQLLSDRRLGVTATARNWRTVTRLLELSGSAT